MSTPVSDAPAQALAARRPAVITEPGVHDIRFEDYLRDPVPEGSLSASGAKLLLPPSCPALFRYEQLHRRPPKKEFEIGTAAHALVLGSGPELVQIDEDDWRTTKAKAEVADARERGAVPLKPAEFAMVTAMAEALRAHPVAAALFDPARGLPEQSLFWIDEASGVWRRGRLDWLPVVGTGRMVVPDYKTADSVDKDKLSKSMHSYGYHIQAATYLDGIKALGIDAEPAFLNVFQEKRPPYLVRVMEPDVVALNIARDLNRRAIDIYAECKATDRWPGHDGIELLSLPGWVENNHEWGLS